MTVNLKLNSITKNQIDQCLALVQEIFEKDLLGVYLYGSAIVGGLQKYSDLDLLVVLSRATNAAEKAKLVKALLKISGLYMKDTKPPIELTIVVKSEVNPWHYPPNFDFQYGEWLREGFEQGNIEPWYSKEMNDLAILITQILLASKTLLGVSPNQLLNPVPYIDFMKAMTDSLPSLISELESDTRNVLLTLARIWSTISTDAISSKPDAAEWALNLLPEEYRPIMNRANSICQGEAKDIWDDLQERIEPCANFMITKINNKMIEIMRSDDINRRSIKLAHSGEIK